jgi:tRNA1Val (adenine37-N6)-methyltransferase
MFLYQPTSGYCYNSDSIFLYDFIASFAPRGKLLDVGCGVGILSLLLTRDFELETTIIDKQEHMISYAIHNFELNGLHARAVLGDFVRFESSDRYDYIISNPPFYHSEGEQSSNTHLNTARYAHHLPLDSFIAQVKSLLSPRGYFIFCYDAKQLSTLLATLQRYTITPERIVFVHSKEGRDAKLVMIEARNNSKALAKILPPLVVFDENNRYQPNAQEAFKRANTHSIKGDF